MAEESLGRSLMCAVKRRVLASAEEDEPSSYHLQNQLIVTERARMSCVVRNFFRHLVALTYPMLAIKLRMSNASTEKLPVKSSHLF